MIKPDGLSGNYTDEIKNAILESGFIILREMTVRLDEDTAGKFYAEHSSRSFFPALVKYMTRYLLPDINSCYFFYSKYYWLDRLYCLIKVDNYCSHHKFHISSLNWVFSTNCCSQTSLGFIYFFYKFLLHFTFLCFVVSTTESHTYVLELFILVIYLISLKATELPFWKSIVHISYELGFSNSCFTSSMQINHYP